MRIIVEGKEDSKFWEKIDNENEGRYFQTNVNCLTYQWIISLDRLRNFMESNWKLSIVCYSAESIICKIRPTRRKFKIRDLKSSRIEQAYAKYVVNLLCILR